jgi:hypothetical protein
MLRRFTDVLGSYDERDDINGDPYVTWFVGDVEVNLYDDGDGECSLHVSAHY